MDPLSIANLAQQLVGGGLGGLMGGTKISRSQQDIDQGQYEPLFNRIDQVAYGASQNPFALGNLTGQQQNIGGQPAENMNYQNAVRNFVNKTTPEEEKKEDKSGGNWMSALNILSQLPGFAQALIGNIVPSYRRF